MVRIKIVILCLLGLMHVGATVYLVAPGYISIDEALHHWTTRAYSVTGGFALWNGYDEFATPELHHPYIRVHDGKLYSQYPPLFSVLALPFYRLFGFYGLFVLNSVCFVLAVLISFFTAMRLFEDTELALNCLVLSWQPLPGNTLRRRGPMPRPCYSSWALSIFCTCVRAPSEIVGRCCRPLQRVLSPDSARE